MKHIKRFIFLVALVLAMVVGVMADPPAPFPIEINSQSRVAPEVWTYRNNTRTFRCTFKDGTNTVDLTGATIRMTWSTNVTALDFQTSSVSVVSMTGGVADFTFAAAALNYAMQTNIYEVSVDGTVAVYNQGRFLIKPSPFSTGTNATPFTTNQNLTGYSFSGQPWIETLTLTTGGDYYAWSGSGTTRNLNVPTNTAVAVSGSGTTTQIIVGVGSSSRLSVSNGATANVTLNFNESGLSTGTPLYVETYTGSVGSIAGLATGTPLYVETYTGSVGSLSGVATGSPLYVESDTAAIAQVGSASSTLRIAIGLVNTGLINNGLADTNFVGLVNSNSATIGQQITNNLIADGLLSTNVGGFQVVTTNALGLLTTNLNQNGLTDTNLSGRVTTNYAAQGLISTNLAGFQVVTTNALGLLTTNLTREGLATTNLSGLVTTNYTELGLARTNIIQVGVIVTNNSGAISTNYGYFTTLNGSVVSKTSLVGQVMSSSLQSLGTFHANTNIIAADTNTVSSEKLSNGTFTGSAAGWALTNASYNANNVLVLPSAAASVTYTSSTPVVAGKVYLLSWVNDLAYGTDFTTFTVVVGGRTNVFGNAPTGTIATIFQARNAQNPQFFVAPGTNQWVGDTISLKEITAGQLIVGDDGFVGGRLFVGEGIETTGTISGVVTGYLPLVGGTMTGPVTTATVTANGVITLTTNAIYFDGSTNANFDGAALFGIDGGIGVSNIGSSVSAFNAMYINAGRNLTDTGSVYLICEEASDNPGQRGLFVYAFTNMGHLAALYDNKTYAYGDNDELTISAGVIRVSGALYANGAYITNLPAAATTAGVNQISATGAVSGNITFSGSGVQQTNTTFYFPLVAAVQTGQVDSISNTGAVRGAIVITGSAVTQTGNTFNISATGGGATGTPVQVIDAGANITVTRTGDTVNIVGSAGGSGATQAIATVGSSTVTSTISGATLSWSNSVTGGGASNPGFTDYFHAQLNAAGAAAWTITAGTWLTGKYNVVRSNAQGVWKTNSYTWIYTSTGLVFATFHIQPYHAAGYRYAVLYRNGVQFLGVSEDSNSASGQYFDFGGVVIWENDAATNEYSAVFFAEAIGYSAALSDGQTNLEYITGGRFQ